MSQKRDKKTGKFLTTETTPLKCPLCGGSISQSSYYSGKKRCRACYFLSIKKGRTPNTQCQYCGTPLYKSPNVLSKKSLFSCSKCKKRARREYVAKHPEVYKKIVERGKQRKGIKINPEKYICPDCGSKKSYSSKRCLSCSIKMRSGENNCSWKGGITEFQRKERNKFSQTIRKKILDRDNYTCQICGKRGGRLQVDHIKPWCSYPELRFEGSNCRTICEECHYRITFGREKPKHVLAWGLGLSQRGG